jgi:hypothetical protein
VPAGLQGSVWFARDTLDIRRLEVRVAEMPRTIRVAATREVTSYTDAVVGDVPAVLPVESELVLRDRDGSERRNRARFDDCHRYSGSATVRYDTTAAAAAETPAARDSLKRGQRVEMKFESGIGADVAIGDVFTFGAAKVRVTDVRQAGDRWNLEFSLVGARGSARRTLALPAPPGTTITLRAE